MEAQVPRFLVFLLLLAASSGFAAAAEIVDQANEDDLANAGWTNMIPPNGVGQSFTPTLDNLTAVEISIVTGNDTGLSSERLTASVWELGGTAALGEASIDVTAGFDGWLRFDFSPAISLTPGQQVLLRVEDEGFVTFGWHYALDTYAGGEQYFLLAPKPEFDFFFRTYGESDRCVTTATRLCLGEGSRYTLEITWKDLKGNTGTGQVLDIGKRDSGLYYFFNENNAEMLVKVLNGCRINNHYWVFYAATTNVEFTLQVTDTETKQVKTYTNPLGKTAESVTDTSAFATCP